MKKGEIVEVKKIWFVDDNIFIETDKGKKLFQSLLWYPRLLNATHEQREKYEYDNIGIRWEELDEDMSIESFTFDNPTPQGVALVFRKHPELNAAAVARRVGIPQSLLAAYISGSKTPSPQQELRILRTIKEIGKELYELESAV